METSIFKKKLKSDGRSIKWFAEKNGLNYFSFKRFLTGAFASKRFLELIKKYNDDTTTI